MSSAFTSSGLVRSFQLIFIITILASNSYAFAALSAKGNVTLQEIGDSTFASEPHGRGTVGILLSCTTTFIFCIWTAVHPNVVPGVKTTQRVYYKAVLMVISIFIPEGLVVSAIGEYREAKRLLNAWNRCKKIPPEYKCKMDMHVAFFVVMGGFIVDEINPEDDQLPAPPGPGLLLKSWRFLVGCILCKPCRKEEKVKKARREFPYRARLTPTGFKTYMEKGLIHHESFRKADVMDKGKASAIAKFLAGIQALWLVVQSISRAGAGLPLSLLEIHVLIHVGRTALIYWFWWYKPLDVNEPIRIQLRHRGKDDAPKAISQEPEEIQEPKHDPIAARVLQGDFKNGLRSPSPSTPYDDDSTLCSGRPTPVSRVSGTPEPFFNTSYKKSPIDEESVPAPAPPRLNRGLSEWLKDDFHIHPLHGKLPNGVSRCEAEINRSKTFKVDTEGKEPRMITSRSPQSSYLVLFYKAIYDIIIYLDVADREEREERAAKADPDSMTPPLDKTQLEVRVPRSGIDTNVAQTSITEGTPAKDRAWWAAFSFVMFGEMFLVCLTGALHALAWNTEFPTPVERWLWRSASLTMCACALGVFMIANFTQYEQDLIAAMLEFHLDTNVTTNGAFKDLRKSLKKIHRICKTRAGKNGGSKARVYLGYIKHICGMSAILLLVAIYFCSVSYITIESFIALRQAPLDMWMTPSWTDYWPHV